MSTNTAADTLTPRIVPDEFFYSVFRNATNSRLYVWWVGTHGMNIEPGAYFKVEGDPRVPDQFPTSRKRVKAIKEMLEEGLIEFCSSPPPILDDQMPNGVSMAMVGNSGSPAVDKIPLDRDEVAARTLPALVPLITYNATGDLITVDWSATPGLEPHDVFTILVTPPSGEAETVRAGHDRMFQYIPRGGYGDYIFVVTITGIDGREQTGPETIFEHEEPEDSGGDTEGSSGQEPAE
jgi:hypothetical protein